ncbi:MAG TPA: ABC transporter substrate-binding protein, partial [Thermomicrobiales bacterium]|nr:ABC transporter substrate-binding protein [Thermomicrobiales bacterium]
CGNDDDDDAGDGGATTSTEPAGAATTTGTEASSGGGEVTKGGTLIFGHNREPDSLDPHKVTSVISSDWMLKLYDTIVTVLPDLSTIDPGLADSWEVSDDGLTYTFTLKEGVEFHSGDPFTAADAKFTIDRWLAEETASPTKHRIAGISNVEAPDDTTLVLTLEARNNELLINMASGFGSVLNQSFVEEAGADYGTLKVDGTGPFKLDNWAPRAEATFSRFDKYTWGPPFYENSGPVHIDQLVLRIIPEDTTRILELESGGVHIVPVVPTSDAQNLESNDDIEIIQGESGQTTYLGMNLRKEILAEDHKPVRVAIMHAIDREQIVNEILSGYAVVAWGPVAPWIKGALPDVEEYGYAFDPEQANQILDEAGWVPGSDGIREKDGVRLTIPIYATANDQNTEMMGLFSSNLADVGVEVESVMIEEAAIWARLAAGEHTIMLMGMPHSTPDEILMFYFLSENQPAPNRFGFADPEVDEWLKDARQAETEEQWLEDYHNIQKRVLETAFWMPLYHPYQLVGLRKNEVQGFNYYGLYQIGSWKLLDVSLTS